jgi:hypothetical protein
MMGMSGMAGARRPALINRLRAVVIEEVRIRDE